MANDALPFWITTGLSLGLLVAAAKAHGRQVRLERELEGHWHVTIGGKDNPAWVEALWRNDRIRFWTTVPTTAAVAVAYLVFAPSLGGPVPRLAGSGALARAGVPILVALLWSPVVAFAANGLLSLIRFRAALAGPPKDPAAWDTRGAEVAATQAMWLRDARRGNLLWWSLVLVLGALVAVLAA